MGGKSGGFESRGILTRYIWRVSEPQFLVQEINVRSHQERVIASKNPKLTPLSLLEDLMTEVKSKITPKYKKLRGHQKTKLPVVPWEHQKMVSTIKQLPDIQIPIKYRDQRVLLYIHKNFWKFIAIRIDFFQFVQLGYTPLDPLNNQGLHPFDYRRIDVMSRYYFSILQLVIKAFSVIREAALKERRSFPFENPRELFEQICRDNANGGTAELRSNGLNQGFELKTLRENLRMWHKFYRDGDALPEEEHNEILLELQAGDWSEFWIFAIWRDKEKTPLRNTWKNFKDAHKSICQFMDKNDYPDMEVTMIKLNAGKAFSSRSMQPVNSWGI